MATPSSSTLAYDAASQLSGVGHDALGRTTGSATRVFEWDAASRLTRFAAGAETARFSYDAFGQQLTSTQSDRAVRLAWNYGHGYPTNDDLQVILPTPQTSYYVRAPSGLLLYALDGSSGERSFYHYDESGNTLFLTNDDRSIMAAYAYAPHGAVAVAGQAAENPFTFGAAAGIMRLPGGLFSEPGGTIFDTGSLRVISGHTICSGPLRKDPGPLQIEPDVALANVPGPFVTGSGEIFGEDYSLSLGVMRYWPVANDPSIPREPGDLDPYYPKNQIFRRYSVFGHEAFASGLDESSSLAENPDTDGDDLTNPWESDGWIDVNCDPEPVGSTGSGAAVGKAHYNESTIRKRLQKAPSASAPCLWCGK